MTRKPVARVAALLLLVIASSGCVSSAARDASRANTEPQEDQYIIERCYAPEVMCPDQACFRVGPHKLKCRAVSWKEKREFLKGMTQVCAWNEEAAKTLCKLVRPTVTATPIDQEKRAP